MITESIDRIFKEDLVKAMTKGMFQDIQGIFQCAKVQLPIGETDFNPTNEEVKRLDRVLVKIKDKKGIPYTWSSFSREVANTFHKLGDDRPYSKSGI